MIVAVLVYLITGEHIGSTKVHFCDKRCAERFLYEAEKEAFPYVKNIIHKEVPEFYSWNGGIYHDYPYQDRSPSKIIAVYKLDDNSIGSDAVNSILLVTQDMRNGRVNHFSMFQYENSHNHKESFYTGSIKIEGGVLSSIIGFESDFTLLDSYLGKITKGAH